MNIESLATGMSQAGWMQNVGMQVQKMALNQSELQGEAIQKLFASAEIIQDPALGQKIDILA
jgi:hypothetical protein